MRIPLIKPYIDNDIKSQVLEVLDSGFLTEGIITNEFENRIRDYVESEYAIAFTSCTTGLEAALRCLGIGPGDEVIVPDYTYPATAAVAPLVGATSVIVDVCRDNMLIDYDLIESAITSKTRAIIPVSLFGNPLDYDRLNLIKNKHNLFIIEDAACSLGAEWDNIKVGSLADISVFSLHPRKFITTGEGGIVTTNNKEWSEWLNSFKHFGMGPSITREGTVFNIIGTNYKLSNVLAAIGLGQLKKIDLLLSRRRELAFNYDKLIKGHPFITLPDCQKNAQHSYQSYTVFIPRRDDVMKKMRSNGIEVQIGTYSLHNHPAFQNNPRIRLSSSFENSNWVYDHCLTLPLYHDLTFEQQELIIEELIKEVTCC